MVAPWSPRTASSACLHLTRGQKSSAHTQQTCRVTTVEEQAELSFVGFFRRDEESSGTDIRVHKRSSWKVKAGRTRGTYSSGVVAAAKPSGLRSAV